MKKVHSKLNEKLEGDMYNGGETGQNIKISVPETNTLGKCQLMQFIIQLSCLILTLYVLSKSSIKKVVARASMMEQGRIRE